MQPRFNRRSAPKVRDGKVQRKNRHIPTTHQGYVLDRRPPGKGYTHVLSKKNLQDFIDLLPDWHVYSERLERIVLAPGDSTCDGYHQFHRREGTGSISLCAWEKQLWTPVAKQYFADHKPHFQALGLSFDTTPLTHVLCRFTIAQARAFTLLHVFLHELGHHYDRLTRRNTHSGRGEEFAESFANRRFDDLLPRYIARFGDPCREAGNTNLPQKTPSRAGT
jgi:hypothetical protein